MSESVLHPEKVSANKTDVCTVEPVRKSVRVATTVERAFAVFTEEMDSWWPRTHSVAGSSIGRVVVEGRAGGAVFSEQEDGTISRWGTVLDWDPPHRFVMSWQLSPKGLCEPDLAEGSEIEVTFRPTDGSLATVVELEHRGFERHGMIRVETDATTTGESCRRSCFAWTAENASSENIFWASGCPPISFLLASRNNLQTLCRG